MEGLDDAYYAVICYRQPTLFAGYYGDVTDGIVV